MRLVEQKNSYKTVQKVSCKNNTLRWEKKRCKYPALSCMLCNSNTNLERTDLEYKNESYLKRSLPIWRFTIFRAATLYEVIRQWKIQRYSIWVSLLLYLFYSYTVCDYNTTSFSTTYLNFLYFGYDTYIKKITRKFLARGCKREASWLHFEKGSAGVGALSPNMVYSTALDQSHN